MRRIAVINQKGGVGKTTSCCNLGAALASSGRSVLLIDLDPQANLTMHLGIEPDTDNPSVYDILTDSTSLSETTVKVTDKLHVIPSHIDLAAAEMELVSVMGREVILRDALQPVTDQYDFIMIDCPPSLGILTLNGLAAMDEVIIPMQPHFLALQGVGKLLETIKLVQNRINASISLTGVILCMYDAGTRLASEVAADLREFLESSRNTDEPWANARIFDTIIRRNIKLAECPSHGLSIFDYAPKSNGAVDYTALAGELVGDSDFQLQPGSPETATENSDSEISNTVEPEPPVAESDAQEPADETPASETATDDVPPFTAVDRTAYGPEEISNEEPEDGHEVKEVPTANEPIEEELDIPQYRENTINRIPPTRPDETEPQPLNIHSVFETNRASEEAPEKKEDKPARGIPISFDDSSDFAAVRISRE